MSHELMCNSLQLLHQLGVVGERQYKPVPVWLEKGNTNQCHSSAEAEEPARQLVMYALQGFLGVLAIYLAAVTVVILNVGRSKMAVTSHCIQVSCLQQISACCVNAIKLFA